MARPKTELNKFKTQIKAIRERAKDMDVEQQAFFLSTLERYETQVELVDKLRIEVNKGETTVKKEYVKGRENIVINPVITAYNQAVASANKTVETLTKIIKSFAEIKGEKPDDPLIDILNGTVD